MTFAPDKSRVVIWVLPLLLVPVAFVAAIPWLKTLGDPMVMLITAVAAVFVMSYANVLAFRAQRRLDEVQRAGGAFAAQWGAPAGQVLFVLLLLTPPVQDATMALVGMFGNRGMTIDRTVVLVTLTLGFCGLVVLQNIGTLAINAFWWRARR